LFVNVDQISAMSRQKQQGRNHWGPLILQRCSPYGNSLNGQANE